MKILGLDVGSKTVGVAVSDALGWTSQGLEIIPINENKEEFGIARLGEIIDANNITGVVVGLPKNMNNSEGERAVAARNYANLVEQTFHLPTDFQDERLTTVEAQRMLVEEADISRAKQKKVIDKLAAALILQNYLDAKGKLTKGN